MKLGSGGDNTGRLPGLTVVRRTRQTHAASDRPGGGAEVAGDYGEMPGWNNPGSHGVLAAIRSDRRRAAVCFPFASNVVG